MTVISDDSALPLLNAALDSPEKLGLFFFQYPPEVQQFAPEKLHSQ